MPAITVAPTITGVVVTTIAATTTGAPESKPANTVIEVINGEWAETVGGAPGAAKTTTTLPHATAAAVGPDGNPAMAKDFAVANLAAANGSPTNAGSAVGAETDSASGSSNITTIAAGAGGGLLLAIAVVAVVLSRRRATAVSAEEEGSDPVVFENTLYASNALFSRRTLNANRCSSDELADGIYADLAPPEAPFAFGFDAPDHVASPDADSGGAYLEISS